MVHARTADRPANPGTRLAALDIGEGPVRMSTGPSRSRCRAWSEPLPGWVKGSTRGAVRIHRIRAEVWDRGYATHMRTDAARRDCATPDEASARERLAWPQYDGMTPENTSPTTGRRHRLRHGKRSVDDRPHVDCLRLPGPMTSYGPAEPAGLAVHRTHLEGQQK